MEVRLFATFRENRDKILDVPWYEGMDGNALFKMLDIDVKEVSIFLVNGAHKKPDYVFAKDDVIALFPPVGGG